MYGDNTAQLRDALGNLMQFTRNGPGVKALPTDAVELVGSFRHSITVWCQQAVRASNPNAELDGTTPRTRGPAEELRVRLAEARAGYAAPLPTVEQLATPHPHYVVDLWRQAAKGAALGEHDFPAGLTYGALNDAEAMTVLKDAAEVTRALTGIDRHYATAIPGWEPIEEADLLGRAAVVCAAHAGYDPPDYAVDRRGWRPPAQVVEGPGLPGLAGVLQAQNNLLVHLRHQPDGYGLRLILDSQRIVSTRAALLSRSMPGHQELADKWERRSATYDLLVDQTRNLRGLLGTGHAAGEGAMAASRIQNLNPDPHIEPRQLRHLDALFTHIDRRLVDTILAGADDRSYLMRVPISRVDVNSPGPVKAQRARHIPLDVQQRTPVLHTVKTRLMPRLTSLTCPPGGAASRQGFTQALDAARPPTTASPGLSL